MPIKFSNFARTTLAVGASSGALSLSLASGTGARFPTLGVDDYFYLTLENAILVREIVKVTARTVDTLTVVRAQDGTTAQAWNAGDVASLRFNAQGIVDSIGNSVQQTGPTGAVINPVGTTGQRPTPVYGHSRINSTLNIPEWWNGTAWVPMGGGATGGGTDALGVENDTFIGTPYTIGSAAILPCTISIASPCVVTQANTYLKDQTVRFTSTGALPTGLSVDGVYFIITAGLTTSSFQVSLTQGGTAVNTSGTQSGTQGVGKTKNMNVAGGITIGDAGGITIPTGCGLVIGG